jgi:hypothetical protein
MWSLFEEFGLRHTPNRILIGYISSVVSRLLGDHCQNRRSEEGRKNQQKGRKNAELYAE